MHADEFFKSRLVQAVPERSAELEELFDSYKPKCEVLKDKVGTTYTATLDRVAWDIKSIAHDWIVTFAAWPIFCAYCPLIVIGRAFGGKITRDLIIQDAELEAVESVFDSICYSANEIRRCSELSEFSWPSEVPRLTSDRGELAIVEQFCSDIAWLANAATFLHEFAHVQFWVDASAPENALDEERACDTFSREFLLANVQDYALESSNDVDKVLSKRVMGLATAAFIIDESSRNVGIAGTHPTSGDRFRFLALQAPASEHDYCWVYTASLMLACARRRGLFPAEIAFTSALDLCKKLAVTLDI